MDKPHLSVSQMSMYMRCPAQYEFAYIRKMKRPPGISQLRGRGVHFGAQTNFKQKVESFADLPHNDIVDAAVSGFDTEIHGGYELNSDEQSQGAEKVIGSARDTVGRLAGLYAEQVAPDYQPVMVEEKVSIILPEAPYDLLGIIDVADDQNRIVDMKTSTRKTPEGDVHSSLQLTTYAAAFTAKTGETPSEVRLEVLVDKKKPERQTLCSQRDSDDFQVLANTMNAIIKGITSGSFPPNTNGWHCSPKWCGYYSECPYVNSKKVYSIGE